MKKIISLVLATILILSLFMSAGATNSKYSYGDIEIIFEEDCAFSEEMKQKVAEYIVNGDDGATTYNLLCTLFGHKETVELVATITHKVDSKNPRCLQQFWDVHGCTRCEEALGMDFLSETYIECCPED